MTQTEQILTRNTRRGIAAAIHVPQNNYEHQLEAVTLADFDESIDRAAADEFAAPNVIGRLCRAWETAAC